MSSPEFYTTGAPGSAIYVPLDHNLDYQKVDLFGKQVGISTMNKIPIVLTDPIGTSPESKKRIEAIANEVQNALSVYSTKTEMWGSKSIEFLLRKWRECFIDAVIIGRIFKVSNNDYSKFTVDNMDKLCYRLAGAAAGEWKVIRDNLPNYMNTYLDLCERLERICIPYYKQISDIFEVLSCFYVDTDPEKKLPSIACAYPNVITAYDMNENTTNVVFYVASGNTMSDMLAHFEANLDDLNSIIVDGKNYASDIKKALAQAYKRSPLKPNFFREYVTKPMAWYAHKMKAAQFRNGGVVYSTVTTCDLKQGALVFTMKNEIKNDFKAAKDEIIVDLYSDGSWKDLSRSLASQLAYCPVGDLVDQAFTVTGTIGIIPFNWVSYAAADTLTDTLLANTNFDIAWSDSHSSLQDTATKALRAWMSCAQCYSDAPLEFGIHHDEVWFTGKIDDFVKVNKVQRQDMTNLVVSCMVRIAPASAIEVFEKQGISRGKKPRKGNSKPKEDKQSKE